MTTNIYSVDVSILLTAIGTPACKIWLGGSTVDLLHYQFQNLVVNNRQWINLSYHGPESGKLIIEHCGKSDEDRSTAVVVNQIRFNEIYDPGFVYKGVYTPKYPSHIIRNNTTPDHIPGQNYLGWNGTWTLDFTLPIYTWIHQTKNLGWIYD